MIKLRTLLLCNYLYYILLFISLLYVFIYINIPYKSSYSTKSKIFKGVVTSIKKEGATLSITSTDKNKEYIVSYFYFKTKKERDNFNLDLGDNIYLEGTFTKIQSSTTFNTFNYKEYLERRRTYYSINITSLKKISSTTNIIYILKNNIYKYFTSFKNSSYLKLILLGDKSSVNKEILSSFRENGISHLFAISGMHVSFITTLILKILNMFKVREEKRYFITSFILLIYLLLIGSSPSIIRSFLFFILLSVNKIYYFNIDNIYIFILTLSITLIINPFFIFDIAFQYSFLISFTLIIVNSTESNYFKSLIKTSLLSFLISFPITIYNFCQINILSILYNLFYVPFVTFILFPVSLLVLICPYLSFIYDILITILEKTSLLLNSIDIFKIVFCKVNISIYFVYILLAFLYLNRYKYIYLIIFLLVSFIHFLYPFINNNDFITMLDVGQGDSTVIHSKNKTLLIDTGGVVKYYTKKWQKKSESSIVKNITIPYLKSKGISKIDYLVLTHGDFDHLGETINLINNFRVSTILINEGKTNYLEKNIISHFKNTNICREGYTFNIGDFSFLSINHNLSDENSSSIVLYSVYKNYKLLFMGDANFKSEEYILNNYELSSVDFLKLGHHGSKTSTSDAFLKKVKPSIALISAGRNNKFNHPSSETLKRLKKYKIKYYSTKESGSIEFNFTNGKILKNGI